jgi:hypothetical protein
MVNREGSSPAVERVWRRVLEDPRRALERGLIPTDLQTVLLAVARARAHGVGPARLVRRWSEDVFVQPSPSDPRALWKVEARLWELLPASFTGVDLSPITPLGTCAAVASVDQNRVITTVRGSEVVSDPTNVLALEAARRRRQKPSAPVHLAACHRVVRAQRFSGPGLFQHFRLFALVSSGRDQGSGALEAGMLIEHLRFWAQALTDLLPGRRVLIEFSAFDSPVVLERYRDTVVPALEPWRAGVAFEERPERQRARGYYNQAAVLVRAEAGGAAIELGDGGFTDWTAQLTADAKERCLISCISTERLTQLTQAG